MLQIYIARKKKSIFGKIFSRNNGTTVGQYMIFHLSLQATEKVTDWYFHINSCKNFPLENLLDEKYSHKALCLDIQLNIKLSQLPLTSLVSAFYMFSYQRWCYISWVILFCFLKVWLHAWGDFHLLIRQSRAMGRCQSRLCSLSRKGWGVIEGQKQGWQEWNCMLPGELT